MSRSLLFRSWKYIKGKKKDTGMESWKRKVYIFCTRPECCFNDSMSCSWGLKNLSVTVEWRLAAEFSSGSTNPFLKKILKFKTTFGPSFLYFWHIWVHLSYRTDKWIQEDASWLPRCFLTFCFCHRPLSLHCYISTYPTIMNMWKKGREYQAFSQSPT